MSLVSFVIPVYREAGNIPALADAIEKEMASVGLPHELILVDDGSPDGTWETIKHTRCIGIRLSRNFGKEAALMAGLDHANGDAVIVMDADFQHPPALIPEMINRWRRGEAEVVEGIKIDRGRESFAHRVAANTFYRLFHRLCGLDLEGASDFKLLDSKVVRGLRQMRESNIFFRGMSSWVGFRHTTLPFDVAPRVRGSSGWTLRSLIRLATTGLTSFTAAPLHFVTAMGGGFLVLAVILGIRAIVVKAQGLALNGFTLLVLLHLFLGSLILIGLGIIGEYLARMYIELKSRPRYLIDQTVGLDEADSSPTSMGRAA